MLWKFMGKVRKFPFAPEKNVFKNQLLFLLTKISEMCNHLSLGVRHTHRLRDPARNCIRNNASFRERKNAR